MTQGNKKKIFHYPCSAWNPYNRIIKEGIEANGLDVVLVEGRKAAALKGEEPPGLAEGLKQLISQAGIVHFHWIGSMTVGKGAVGTLIKTFFFLILLTVLRICRIKLVITLHNLLPHDKGHLRVQTYSRRLVLKFFDAVILHSASARKLADEIFGIEKKSVVIPHPSYTGYYPDEATREEARSRFGLDMTQKVILFFGMLRPYKQVDTLLAALSAPSSEDDLVLIIAGMNKMGDRMPASAASGGSIILHDRFIPDEEVQYYFRCADCLVLPTSSPSALTSGAAALSVTFETPIVARDYTPFHEFFELGLGVPCNFSSTSELLTAVGKVLSGDRAEFVRRCEQYNRETDVKKIGHMHARIYRNVAGPAVDP